MIERKDLPLNHDAIPSTKEAIAVWCRDFLNSTLVRTWAREYIYLIAYATDENEVPVGADAALRRALLCEWQRRRIEEIHGDALNLTHDHCPELAERAERVMIGGSDFEQWYRRAVAKMPRGMSPAAEKVFAAYTAPATSERHWEVMCQSYSGEWYVFTGKLGSKDAALGKLERTVEAERAECDKDGTQPRAFKVREVAVTDLLMTAHAPVGAGSSVTERNIALTKARGYLPRWADNRVPQSIFLGTYFELEIDAYRVGDEIQLVGGPGVGAILWSKITVESMRPYGHRATSAAEYARLIAAYDAGKHRLPGLASPP